MRSCSPGVPVAAVQIAEQGLDENVVDQRALAGAADARHADERAQRNLDVDVLQVVVLAPTMRSDSGFGISDSGFDDLRRLRDVLPLSVRIPIPNPKSEFAVSPEPRFSVPDKNCPVTLCFSLATLAGRAVRDDFAAAHAGAGAEIDDVVGRPHRVFVVLDDDDRVAHVAQLRERVEQPVVVARVQADRRLVEDVQHADQAAADLAGQANALRLAAGERRGRAVERQIVEPHVRQEAEPAANFLEHFGGDQLAACRSRSQLAEELDRVGDRQGADLGQRACRADRRTLRCARGDASPLRACGFSRCAVALRRSASRACTFRAAAAACLLLRSCGIADSSSGMMPSKWPPYFWPDGPCRQVKVMCSSPVPHSQISCSAGSTFAPGRLEHRARRAARLAMLDRVGHALIDVPLPAAHVAATCRSARSSRL